MSELVKRDVTLLPLEVAIIDDAVKFINEKAQETIYKGAEEIGAYILDKFFDNDLEVATSRNPMKIIGYRSLCERPDLLLRHDQLSVMVRVAAQERFLKEKKIDTSKLTYSHKAELVKLDNDDDKVKLVKSIIAKPISVRALQDQVWKLRNDSTKHPQVSLTGLHLHAEDPKWLLGNALRKELLMDAERRREHIARMNASTQQRLYNTVDKALRDFMQCGTLFEAIKDDIRQVQEETAQEKAKQEAEKKRRAEERAKAKAEADEKRKAVAEQRGQKKVIAAIKKTSKRSKRK